MLRCHVYNYGKHPRPQYEFMNTTSLQMHERGDKTKEMLQRRIRPCTQVISPLSVRNSETSSLVSFWDTSNMSARRFYASRH